MAELMSRMAYARHRGCVPSAVRYAIRRGWIVPAPDGRIDVQQADAAWPLERRHGPQAWVMGPAYAGPPSALSIALAAEIEAMEEIAPLSEEELRELLGEEP